MKEDEVINTTAGSSSTIKIKTINKTVALATVATTTKKKSGNSKTKDDWIKIVLRHLPAEMTKEELWEQLQPLPEEPCCAFWFCRSSSELQPSPFSRAYIIFKEERNAVKFAERFNGYVFVDKRGNESMAIVECAANQHVPKHLDKTAKECDVRSGTLENEAPYLKYMDMYHASLADRSRRVTNFDDLVKELEEKERRLAEGQVQETPLTAFFRQSMDSKSNKKQQKFMERLTKLSYGIPSSAIKWDKSITKSVEFGNNGKEKKKRKQNKPGKKPKEMLREQDGVSSKSESGKERGIVSENISDDAIGKELKSRGVRNKLDSNAVTATQHPENKESSLEKLQRPIKTPKKELLKKTQSNSNESAKTSMAKDGRKANKNKLPDREIYRPGKARLQQQKTTGDSESNNVNVSMNVEQRQQ